MKRLMKLTCVILILSMVSAFLFPTLVLAAEESKDASVEVVILFDVSGSMTSQADPPSKTGNRLSVEAAQLFALNRMIKSDFYIKVIPYCHKVYTGFESVNVRTETGLAEYMDNMQAVLNDYKDQDTIPGINCYESSACTDIGTALSKGVDAIRDSTCDRKAVVLFTDGKIDLPKNSSITEAQSKALAKDSVAELESLGAEFYTIGLDVGGKGYVDTKFINELHGVSKTEDSDHIMIIESAADLTNEFYEVFTDLFPDTVIVDPGSDNRFELEEDTEVERVIHLFEDAVEEANISLSSTAPLKTIKVIAPSGQVVADVELSADGYKNIKKDICSVDYTGMAHSAMIKIFSPMGGDWRVVVTGESGIVVERKLYSAELLPKDTIPSDGAVVYVGDSYTFESAVYNASGRHLATSDIYAEEFQAFAEATVVSDAGVISGVVQGKQNGSNDGYVFEIPTDKVGEFTIEISMEHEIYSLKSTKKIKVVGPQLTVSAEDSDTPGVVNVSLRFINPLTGQPVSDIPDYIEQRDLTLDITKDGVSVNEIVVPQADFINGEYVYQYTPGLNGQYTFHASVKNINGIILESNTADFNYSQKAVVIGDICDSVKDRVLSGGLEHVIDFSGKFTDPEGDALTYRVEVEGDQTLSARVEGEKLIIQMSGFGEGTVLLIAEDGKGSAATHRITVRLDSAAGMVVAIVIIAVVLILAAAAFLVVLYFKKIINVSFRVKIEKRDEFASGGEMIYSIVRLSSKKNAKPVMTLKQILTTNNYYSLISSTMTEEDAELFMDKYADNFVLSGVPFKNQFTVTVKSSDRRAKPRKHTFQSASVVTKTADGAYSVTFGNRNAFEQSDGFIF